jgi:hypothetical protein
MASEGQKDDVAERDARSLIEKVAADDELRGLGDEDDIREEVARTLRDIEALKNARPEGDVSVVIGNVALSISETSWIFLEAAAGLALLAAGPEPITKVAGGGLLLDALFKVRGLIQTLDQTDQAVCTAVTEQRRRKRQNRETETRVTEPEIVAYFKERGEDAPGDLETILDELVSEEVLKRERENNVAYYSIEF